MSLNVLVHPVQWKKRSLRVMEEQPLDTAKDPEHAGNHRVYGEARETALWDIAKKFYTTMEEIIWMNEPRQMTG